MRQSEPCDPAGAGRPPGTRWDPITPETVALAVMSRASGRFAELKLRVCAAGDIGDRTLDELFGLMERLSKVDRSDAELGRECREALGRILHLLPAPRRFRLQQLLDLDARVRQG